MWLFCTVPTVCVMFFGLTPKPFYTSKTKSFPHFFLVFLPRCWRLHAMQMTSGIARVKRWGRCAVKHVLAFHILSPFFSTSFLKSWSIIKFSVLMWIWIPNSQCQLGSAPGFWQTDKIWTDISWTAGVPQVQTSDLDTVVLPKTRMTDFRFVRSLFKSTYLPLQRPLHAASIQNRSRIDNIVSKRTVHCFS